MNENKLHCKDCIYCTKKDTWAGLCTEEHSPKNASGKSMKTVPLWAFGCRYGKRAESPIKHVQKRSRK